MQDYVHGVDYGIKLLQGWIEKFFCNFPIINLLYTKKIHLDVTYYVRSEGHISPAHGTFTNVRVPFWKKSFRCIFACVDPGCEAHVYVRNHDVSEKWCNKDCAGLKWYVSDFTISKRK